MSVFKQFSLVEVAEWLESHDPDRLWTVDGDDRIGRAVDLPCTASELAKTLRSFAKRPAFDVRLDVAVSDDQDPSAVTSLDELGYDDDGAKTFAMKWSDRSEDDVFAVAEDLIAQQALDDANMAPTA